MSSDVADAPAAAELAPADPDDPREQIEVGVLMADGRLAGRRSASRAQAQAWARPEDGEQVVEDNQVGECPVRPPARPPGGATSVGAAPRAGPGERRGGHGRPSMG